MTANTISLTHFYKGWDVYQQHLVTAITPLTSAQLTLRSAPHMWSVGMLATHIVATRASWFHRWMGEGGPEMALIDEWDERSEPTRPAAELVAGLESTWQMIQQALAHWTPADLAQEFQNPYVAGKPARSRQWIIWHLLEHDLHHGGELSLTLGMHGVAALDL